MTCDIELRVGRGSAPGEYRVEVVHAAAGGERESTLALDVEGLLARRDELERALLASSMPARSATTTADQTVLQVGEELFRSLFHGPVNNAYRASLGVAQQRGERLRVVLRLTEPELAGLPWEMLYDSDRRAHLCLEEPIVRRIPAPYVVEPLNVRPPLRVLGLVASPRPLPPLNVEAEVAHLAEAVHEVVEAGLVSLDWVRKATWDNVQHRLISGEWHVVHFIGHGDYDRRRGGLLAFEKEGGRVHHVEASQLAYLLGQAQPSPRLVVLNSCSGGEVGKDDLFSGTASTLVHSGIDAVAAMQFAVSDPAAIAFARGFYTAIAAGRGVDEAVGSGRIAILGLPEVRTLEWATPVLYLRGNITHPIRIEKRYGPGPPPWLESERMYDEALADLLLGRHEPAVQAFRRLVDHDPDYRDAAELYEQAERALTLQPVYDEAVGALDDGNPQRALELVDQILEQSPDQRSAQELRQRAQHELTTKVRYERAVAALGSGDYESAARGLRSVLDLDPDYRDTAELHARAELSVAMRPTYAAAAAELDHDNPERALELVDEILAQSPDHREAAALRQRVEVALQCQPLYDQAVAAMGQREYKSAASLLHRVLELDSAYRDAADLRDQAARARRRRVLMLGGATLVVAGAAVIAWFLLRPATLSDNEVVLGIRDGPVQRLVAVDVESGEVRDIDTPGDDVDQPNPSPDRSIVAYLAARPGHQSQPRLVGADGSDDRALLSSDDIPCPDGVTKAPAWAPDGERVAVLCVDDDGTGTALYTVNASGSDPTLVMSGPSDIGPPAWSSNGEITVWVGAAGQVDGRKGGNLVAVDPETGAVDPLTEELDAHPDWDGEGQLVFLRRGADQDGGDDQIMVLDHAAETTLPGPLDVLVGGFVSNPTWSPDGRRIAYLGRLNAGDPWRLMVMNDDGTNRYQVELPGIPGAPAWGNR